MNFLHALIHRMSRFKGILLVGIVATSACGGSRATEPTAMQFEVYPKALTLEAGKTSQFAVASTPARNVSWTSSNPAVATVSENGTVTGVAAGTVAITARSGSQYSASAVSVTDPPKRLEILPDLMTVATGQTRELVVVSRPAGSGLVTWTSSNLSVATVSDQGIVTGVAAGTATITAIITATSGDQQSASVVTVTDQPVPLQILPDIVTLIRGQTKEFVVVSTPAGSGPVTWASSNPAVATVSERGVASAVAAGTATITATSGGQNSASAVTVTDPLQILPDIATIVRGQTKEFVVASMPAGSGPVTWMSSNPTVVTVSDHGVASGVGAGVAMITATSGGQYSASAVTVTDPPLPLQILPDIVTLIAGQTKEFAVASVPAGSGPVTWMSSNPAVATVNERGVATAVAAGTATITAATGGQYSAATITVTPQPGNQLLWVSPAAVTIEPWMTTRLVVSSRVWSEPFPRTWTSSDTSVAIVNAYGAVTGVATGRATITVMNEGVSAQSEITVAEGPSGGPAWPNEPAGLMLISDYSFDDPLPVGPDAPVGRGWSIVNASGNATLVHDPTTPEVSMNVMQFKYPMGMVDGSGPATMYRETGGHELYVGFWWKASKPFHPHSSGVNKIAFTWSKSNLLSYINMQGTSEPYTITIHDAPLGNAQTLVPNNSTTAVMLGVWHRIELYQKYSTTASSRDGIVRWWVDGVLNGNYTDLNFVQDAGWGEFQFAPTFGGNSGETKPADDYYWFARVRLSGPVRR